MAASLFAQAAQAWIRAGKPQRALYAQDQGLKLNPRDVELLVDRALNYGNSGMYFEALDDLNAASELAPDDLISTRSAPPPIVSSRAPTLPKRTSPTP